MAKLTIHNFKREFSPTFVGRENELKSLEKFIHPQSSRFRPVVISGLAGIGKTTLIKNWLSTSKYNASPLWLELVPEIDYNYAVENFIIHLEVLSNQGYPGDRLIIVIDGSDVWTDQQHIEASNKILNYKIVSSLVFTKRQAISNERFENIVLDPLTISETHSLLNRIFYLTQLNEIELGEIMSAAKGNPLAIELLSDILQQGNFTTISTFLKEPLYELSNNILIPKKEIITELSPIIVNANKLLVTSLQKHPDDLRKLTPREFENLLAELLQDMGWEVELTKQTRDGGADILAYLNTEIGRLLCLVEAKHYREDRKIGVDLVRTLYGTLYDRQANSAMLVTSSTFTKDAKEFQQKHKYQLNLRDYADIVAWILKYGNKQNNIT